MLGKYLPQLVSCCRKENIIQKVKHAIQETRDAYSTQESTGFYTDGNKEKSEDESCWIVAVQ